MITPDLITRSKRKTLSLSILKDGKIVVKAPLKMSNDAISKFIYEKQNWIMAKLSFILSNNQKFQDVIQYKSVLLYGNEYRIKLADVKKIESSRNDMSIYIPNSTPPEKIQSKLKAWYKRIAKNVLEERVGYLSKITKLSPVSIKISDSRGRWGACSSKGNISFNFRVIMLEPSIIDYVIIHELCHLVEMNHSKRFWSLVNSFLPTTPREKESIKAYNFLLSLYTNKN